MSTRNEPAKGTSPNERDREVYDRELRDFLPPRLFDVHVHLLDEGSRVPGSSTPA